MLNEWPVLVGDVVVVYMKTMCDFFSPVGDVVRVLHCKGQSGEFEEGI